MMSPAVLWWLNSFGDPKKLTDLQILKMLKQNDSTKVLGPRYRCSRWFYSRKLIDGFFQSIWFVGLLDIPKVVVQMEP